MPWLKTVFHFLHRILDCSSNVFHFCHVTGFLMDSWKHSGSCCLNDAKCELRARLATRENPQRMYFFSGLFNAVFNKRIVTWKFVALGSRKTLILLRLPIWTESVKKILCNQNLHTCWWQLWNWKSIIFCFINGRDPALVTV